MNVAVPHVTLGGAHAAAVLHRSTGQFELSFVGHHEPTTVTSYNPQLFRGSLGDKPYAVLAVGSQVLFFLSFLVIVLNFKQRMGLFLFGLLVASVLWLCLLASSTAKP
jgi:hypothetical protein